MRVHSRAERAFIARIVGQVRSVVNSGIAVPDKIALLQRLAEVQGQRIESLRALIPRMTGRDSERAHMAERVLETRQTALLYLRATAKYLARQMSQPRSLLQMPRVFAYPNWDVSQRKAAPKATEEFPFMEFSS